MSPRSASQVTAVTETRRRRVLQPRAKRRRANARLERMVSAAVIELFPPIDETRSDKCGGRLRKCG